MNTFKQNSIHFIIWFQWLIATTIGWSVIGYMGFKNRNLNLSLELDAIRLLSDIFLNGFLLGGVIGAIKYLFLHKKLQLTTWWWVFAYIFSYSLSSLSGVLISVIIVWALNKNLFINTPVIFPFPLSLSMLITGLMLGIAQGALLNMWQQARNIRVIAFSLFSSLAWGMAFFVVGFLPIGIGFFLQNIVAGVIIGAITGLGLLLFQMTEINEPVIKSHP